MKKEIYNPDVLKFLSNLSADEVFTSPELVDKMINLLPKELFNNKNTKFLDPACKSGVFLRQIAKKLIIGLKAEIPDLQERIDHIFKHQLFGISITTITSLTSRRSLYCSTDACGKYSITNAFVENSNGNIFYDTDAKHAFINGRTCKMCGVSKLIQTNLKTENHAYDFIHKTNEEIFNMKFDVIIGNPPYQMNDGGGTGSSAKPIYNLFVENAINLKPKYVVMITPSRWFSGGKGLGSFRKLMLEQNQIKEIVDYQNADECFPGTSIEGGVSYFLWDKNHNGNCKISTIKDGKVISEMVRPLLEKELNIFIRYNDAISIYHKVRNKNKTYKSFMELVSVRSPYGIVSTFKNFTETIIKENRIKIYANKNQGYVKKTYIDFKKCSNIYSEWKVFISFAYGMGTFPTKVLNAPFVGKPGEVCTETYLSIGPFKTEQIAKNVISYMNTKFFRFMVLLKKSTQNGTKSVYELVPYLDFNKEWTDIELYDMFNITQAEIKFIEGLVR